MSKFEYEWEPVRGLPALLPPGEDMLWQGAPDWRVLARRAFHLPLVLGYFALLAAWAVATAVSDGVPFTQAGIGIAATLAMGAAAAALILLYAFLIARTTVYTITSKRVVLRLGVALPKCVNLPFARIAGAEVKLFDGGAGDLALQFVPGDRIALLHIWPHARPGHITRPQPSLRAIPDAARVANLLAEALLAVNPGGRRTAAAATSRDDLPAWQAVAA